MIPHLLRYQGLAVSDGGLSRFNSGASSMMPFAVKRRSRYRGDLGGILGFRSIEVLFFDYDNENGYSCFFMAILRDKVPKTLGHISAKHDNQKGVYGHSSQNNILEHIQMQNEALFRARGT